MKHFIVVVYDISHDRRRTKLHQALLDFGTPVQYSVFECWLTTERLKQLQQRVNKVIRPQIDHVRYYTLCATCAAKVQTTRAGEITRIKEVLVV
ncbi:CRISPR-associated endoribonuclease Cas2 [Anaerolineae bacterium]|nr:CRISPR-associated endoribonuclease Cas2 [Anaerolineae bacterium]